MPVVADGRQGPCCKLKNVVVRADVHLVDLDTVREGIWEALTAANVGSGARVRVVQERIRTLPPQRGRTVGRRVVNTSRLAGIWMRVAAPVVEDNSGGTPSHLQIGEGVFTLSTAADESGCL